MTRAAAGAPLALVATCAVAMGAGLAIDTREIDAASFVDLCTRVTALPARMLREWTLMPATHGLMTAVALLAAVLVECAHARARFARIAWSCAHVACVAAMLAGMSLMAGLASGMSVALRLPSFAALTIAMTIGMAAGAMLIAPAYAWLSVARVRAPPRPAAAQAASDIAAPRGA